MKARITTMLALLIIAVTSAWAQDEVTVAPTTNANEWTLEMPDADVELEVEYYTDEEAPFIDGVELTANSDGTWSLAEMPAFDVELEVEYYTQAEIDQMAADEVIAKINAIGTVEYTDASKALIDAARTAYDALTAAQQALVTNYSTLTDAEAAYAELKAAAEELAAAKDALKAIVAADKTIATEGMEGADALADAITTAEAAIDAASATVESIAAARAALAASVATFTKANLGEKFVEIEQTQSPEISDGATRASVLAGDGYTQYNTDGGVCVITKKYDIDVENCDYVTVKFAEPVPAGICIAFWAQGGTDNVGIPAGSFEYKYVFEDDAKCAIANDVLPQITMLTLWNSQTVKIVGIYKHSTEVTSINAVNAQRENGAIYNLNGQKVNKTQKGLYIVNGKKVVIK